MYRQQDCKPYTEKKRGHISHSTCSCPTADTFDCIEHVWFQALEDLEDVDIPHYTQSFTDYKTRQWIEGDGLVWNHFGTEGPRTTNNIEASHGKLKRKVQHSHPNIFTITQTLKEIQNSNDINRI